MRDNLLPWMYCDCRPLSDLPRKRKLRLRKAHEAVDFISGFVGPYRETLEENATAFGMSPSAVLIHLE